MGCKTMITYCTYSINGDVTGIGRSHHSTIESIKNDAGGRLIEVDQSYYDCEGIHWYAESDTGGVVRLVEKCPINTEHFLTNLSVTFKSLPEGSLVYVFQDYFSADGENDVIHFEESGLYIIDIEPPHPKYFSETLEVEIG